MDLEESYNSVKHSLRVYDSVLSMVSENWPTPLVKLRSLSDKEYEVWGKLEFFNVLSHSIKDRPIWYMFLKAKKENKIKEVLYEASSGNVAIALSLLANMHGVKTRLYLPKPTPDYTMTLLRIIGAKVVRTDFETIDQNFITFVKQKAHEDNATNLNQFENDYNPESHYLYTAREIDLQLSVIGKAPPRAIVCGIGTSGHIAAISRYFKNKYGEETKIFGVIPAKGDTIPGIKRVETGPKWLSSVDVDDIIEVRTIDAAKEVINMARLEGLLIGMSSGAVVKAFKEIRDEVGAGVYVLIFPDDIFKYVNLLGTYLNSIDSKSR